MEEAHNFPFGFKAFLRHWHFKNRETGAELTFQYLWPGQENFADLMVSCADDAITKVAWEGIFALKAGKLGFTEVECAWDGYVAWARRNGRVHLFSKAEGEAKQMLGYVAFGLKRLGPQWGVRFLSVQEREIGSESVGTKQFRFTVLNRQGERDFGDVRTVVAYATGKFPAISDSCQHGHVDEWAHMENPAGAWGSISSTIAPSGTCHIVTRGAGEDEDVEAAWEAAEKKVGKLRAFFAPWSARPDRDQAWLLAETATSVSTAALSHYAAETPEDAFRGDEDSDFVPIEAWDHCFDPALAAWIDDPSGPQMREGQKGRWVGNILPGDNTLLILGTDAGVHHDNFGIVGVSRHPERPDDPAIRLDKLWKPEDFEDDVIDFATVESWLRMVCQGGCPFGHPWADLEWRGGSKCKRMKGQAWEPGQCPACEAITAGRAQVVPAFNVYQIAYDPYQLESMMQNLRRDAVVWCYEFNQAKPRLEADANFHTVIVNRRLGHMGSARIREHVANAKAKTEKEQESKIRLVKKAPHRRIDLAVAASMAVFECLRLNL